MNHKIITTHFHRLYIEKYKVLQDGVVGISVNVQWMEARNAYKEMDLNAAERSMQFYAGWFFHPLLIDGDYPKVMKVGVTLYFLL